MQNLGSNAVYSRMAGCYDLIVFNTATPHMANNTLYGTDDI